MVIVRMQKNLLAWPELEIKTHNLWFQPEINYTFTPKPTKPILEEVIESDITKVSIGLTLRIYHESIIEYI